MARINGRRAHHRTRDWGGVQVRACSAFTYGIIGTEWIESIGPAHKQASLPAEQHLHEVAALILQEKHKWREAEFNMQQGDKTEEKKDKNDGVNKRKTLFIFQIDYPAPLCEMKLSVAWCEELSHH